MKKQLVVFGTGKISEVVSYFATAECKVEIAAYVVDEKFKTIETFLGKPVVTPNELKDQYPSDRFDAFVAVGYHGLNAVRTNKCLELKSLGYKLVSIVSPNSSIPGDLIHGENCFVMSPAIVHPCVKLGSNVFVWSGAIIGHHSIIKDNCWLTSGCNIGGNVDMGENCFVAINATVGHSVTVGKNCFLGANTLVTKNLEEEKVVIAESSKPIRLTSSQFLRMSSFSSL